MANDARPVLAFDVFGTVLDWRSSIAAEIRRLARPDASDEFCEDVAEDWAKGYSHAVTSLRGWANLDVLLVGAFGRIARRHGLDCLDAGDYHELSTAWSRLRPWPDAVAGFSRLAGRFTLAALTNANRSMLAEMAAHSGLPWGPLLSAESARAYKPDPAVYRAALAELGLPADRVMLVASHTFDLNAAHTLGFRTALVSHPSEFGSDPSGLDHEADIIAPDLIGLADRLLEGSAAGGEREAGDSRRGYAKLPEPTPRGVPNGLTASQGVEAAFKFAEEIRRDKDRP